MIPPQLRESKYPAGVTRGPFGYEQNEGFSSWVCLVA